MSENPIEVIVEPPLPEVVVIVEGDVPVTDVNVEGPVEIFVEAAPPLPEVVVEVSDVGLPGPKGPPGDPGDSGPEVDLAITAHVHDETPHPAYDDGPSFLLIYENAKV